MPDNLQDAHNQGEQDERDHEDANWIDQALYTHYNPSGDEEEREAYDAGWDNAANQ